MNFQSQAKKSAQGAKSASSSIYDHVKPRWLELTIPIAALQSYRVLY